LYPEQDFSPESWQCSIELSDLDSSYFQALIEPQLELEFEPYDSTGQDICSSAVFPDWEVPGNPEPADLQKCTHGIVLEDDDFGSDFLGSSSPGGFPGERLRPFAAAFAIHFIGFCLLLSLPSPSPEGLGGISDKPIFVRIPVKFEVDTPNIPSKASADSPASTASLARRHPKRDEALLHKESRQEQSKLIQKTESDSSFMKTELAEDTTTAGKKASPDVSFRDGPPNDSKNSQDSMASAPSVATPERKGALKTGDDAQGYKDRILSAIHQAAYFPRAASKKMAYGKAVVSFTINKDGSLADVSIVDHSKSETLDEAALKIVQQASSHFPPIPDELMRDQVTYVVPIVFKRRDQTSFLNGNSALAAASLVANSRRN
jgi:protein TonB